MLDFEDLNVNDEIKSVLKQYQVDFAFQPIYSRDHAIIGYEALMRPEGKDVLTFIEEMKNANKLHELELISFFGATYAYKKRGYDTLLSINSFPSETFTTKEARAYSLAFRPIKEKLIVEILEYTEERHWTWKAKRNHIKEYRGIEVALDDFGTGHNDMQAVSYYEPDMVKIDRSLIAGIDQDAYKQKVLNEIIENLHDKMIAVLAEGVETKEEYEYLLTTKVDFFQGYYLGMPA